MELDGTSASKEERETPGMESDLSSEMRGEGSQRDGKGGYDYEGPTEDDKMDGGEEKEEEGSAEAIFLGKKL